MPEESRRALRRLDPRAPLVVDTRELGRRAGTMRRLARTVAAPADLGLAMIGVPVGAPVELDLRLEAVCEGVLVSGVARAPLAGECARCLEPLARVIEVDLQELFAYPDEASGGDEDEDVSRLEGDLLDLEPTLRDAVVSELPLAPVCREDCPGLCVTCGARLADLPTGHGHGAFDTRWAALAEVYRPTDEDQES
jgi:uncharacterized protein